MRIIGGEARGRRLMAPDGMDTRPTADKVREALFSILINDVPGARVLDLFGGSGALALEAISRGASSAVICDSAQSAIDCIRKNALAVAGESDKVRVIKGNYKKALGFLTDQQFELVFLDPPYRMAEAYAECAKTLLANGMLAPEGLIVAERRSDVAICWPEGLKRIDQRVYRDTALEFVCEDNA